MKSGECIWQVKCFLTEWGKIEVVYKETRMGSSAAGRAQNRKVSRPQAAQRIASLLEQHMSEQGLSEKEKNAKVKQFATRVSSATQRRAKS